MTDRQQLKAIKEELGEDGGEAEGLEKKLSSIQLPDEAQKLVARELKVPAH